MRIEIQTVRGSSNARRTNSKTTTSGFAELVAPESTPSSASSAPLASVQVSDLLILQAAENYSEHAKRKARAVIEANNMLEELDRVHRAMMLGGITHENLTDLSRSLASSAQHAPIEGALQEVVAAIELRVAVEKAKLEVVKEHQANTTTLGVLSAHQQAAIARADSILS